MTYIEKRISAQDGLSLYVRDYPKTSKTGKTIFCLCGLTRNSKDFNELAALLHEKGHRVVTMDYRGRGLSDRDDQWENYDPRVYISDIFNVAAALGLHGCVFIGTSLGGLLSSALCTVAPGLINRVVLNDVGPDLNPKGIAKIIEYTGNAVPLHSQEDALKKMKSYFTDHAAVDDEVFLSILEKTYRLENGMYIPDWDPKIADSIRLSAQKEPDDLWAFFRSIHVRPTLLIRGEESDVLSRETYDKMLESLPNITGVSLRGVGHAPSLNEPEAVEKIVELIDA